MKGWKETVLKKSPVKGPRKEGICTKCLKWPCDFVGDVIDTKKEKVTWCRDILKRGAEIEVGADCFKNGKPIILAGKKFAVEGIKVKRIFEGYYIRVQGKLLLVPKALGHLVEKKTQNHNKRRLTCQN